MKPLLEFARGAKIFDVCNTEFRGSETHEAWNYHPCFIRVQSLTDRQRELLELIAQGRDNSQIAVALGLSEKTVRNHITNIFAKLEVENRSQAIVLARDSGFGKLPR